MKGRDLASRAHDDRPIGRPSRSIGTARRVAEPPACARVARRRTRGRSRTSATWTRLAVRIGPTVDGSALGASGYRRRRAAQRIGGGHAVRRARWSSSPSKRKMRRIVASHSRAALSAMVSKTGWTSVGELLIDPQDLAGRGLLLQRLGEIAVARLQLREQPDVLDGDDGLVGEGLQQLDLLVRERPDLLRGPMMAPIGCALPEHRDGEDTCGASWPTHARTRTRDRPAGPGRARRDRSRIARPVTGRDRRYREQRAGALSDSGVTSWSGDDVQQLAVDPDDRTESAATEPRRALARWCRAPAGGRSASWR